MKAGKTLLALAGAVTLLGALATMASAGRLETSSQTLRGQFRELTFEGLFGTTRCQMTIEGSFHQRTTAKVVATLIGYITRETLGSCAAGTATLLTETLPWHIRYSSFSGTLPNISRVTATIIGVSFKIRTNTGEICIARSTTEEPLIVAFSREAVTGVITGASTSGTARTGAECFGVAGSFSSDAATVSVLNSTTRITVRLI